MEVRKRNKRHSFDDLDGEQEKVSLLDDYDDRDEVQDNHQHQLIHPINNNSFLDSLFVWWNSLWRKILNTTIFPQTPQMPQINDQTRERMELFKAVATESFDEKNERHQERLKALWDLSFPKEKIPSDLESELWKKIGFQSENPLRDFRGTGIFGLRNILYLAVNYPKLYERLVDMKERKTGEHYPFAVASFNVTMNIFEMLGWGWKTPGKTTCKNQMAHYKLVKFMFEDTQDSEEIFNQIYVALLVMLDKIWWETKASYFDFPKVLQQAQAQFEEVISKWESTEDIEDYIRIFE